MFDNILIPLDGSDLAERALPYAASIARGTQARLTLVRATRVRTLPGVDPGPAQLAATERAEADIFAVAGKLRSEGLQVDPRVYHDDAASAILDAAERHKADLIVMSTHGRTGLGRWIYGSVADQILRRAPQPVLLVPAACAQTWPSERPPRIVVPLDGSDLAEAALEPAGQLADALKAEILLLQVVEPPVAPLGEDFAYAAFDEEAELAEAVPYLKAKADAVRAGGRTVKVRAVVGIAPAVISTLAHEEGGDLITMATHGRSGVARLVLGSVATGTLQRAALPILLTRPSTIPAVAATSVETEKPGPAGPPIAVTMSARELDLVEEALGLLLSTTERQEHLAQPLHDLLYKLNQAKSDAVTERMKSA